MEAGDISRGQGQARPRHQLSDLFDSEAPQRDLRAAFGVQTELLPFVVLGIWATRYQEEEPIFIESLRHREQSPARVRIRPVEILNEHDDGIAEFGPRQMFKELEARSKWRMGLHGSELLGQGEGCRTGVLVASCPHQLRSSRQR
jgi:hypothetical protein